MFKTNRSILRQTSLLAQLPKITIVSPKACMSAERTLTNVSPKELSPKYCKPSKLYEDKGAQQESSRVIYKEQ